MELPIPQVLTVMTCAQSWLRNPERTLLGRGFPCPPLPLLISTHPLPAPDPRAVSAEKTPVRAGAPCGDPCCQSSSLCRPFLLLPFIYCPSHFPVKSLKHQEISNSNGRLQDEHGTWTAPQECPCGRYIRENILHLRAFFSRSWKTAAFPSACSVYVGSHTRRMVLGFAFSHNNGRPNGCLCC